ncbi:metallophosphoesterase [Heyndrickxia sp. NPDC080065]|uniref:metallophosphoesterase n=1 Tax=Heyndrickxia sp. NPDC080065 TaxID=3390568 RepID=UPI003CFE1F86
MWIIAIMIVLLLFFYFYKGHKNTHEVVMNQVSLDDSNVVGQPFNVLHISDMHLENISISPEKLYEHLKNESIDLIALTGDFLDRKRSIPKLIPYLKMFNQLHPTYGTYAVFGNHDYFLRKSNFLKLKKVLEDNGCKTLRNENDVLIVDGKLINIIGIDDFSTKRSNIEKSYQGLANGYNLVLTHDPNIVLNMKGFPFDYLLSGHFHGGQIYWPKPYHLMKMGNLVRMNMIKGLQQHDGKSFYISEGLGQTGLNIRIGSRPEITIHHLSIPVNIAKNKKTARAI